MLVILNTPTDIQRNACISIDLQTLNLSLEDMPIWTKMCNGDIISCNNHIGITEYRISRIIYGMQKIALVIKFVVPLMQVQCTVYCENKGKYIQGTTKFTRAALRQLLYSMTRLSIKRKKALTIEFIVEAYEAIENKDMVWLVVNYDRLFDFLKQQPPVNAIPSIVVEGQEVLYVVNVFDILGHCCEETDVILFRDGTSAAGFISVEDEIYLKTLSKQVQFTYIMNAPCVNDFSVNNFEKINTESGVFVFKTDDSAIVMNTNMTDKMMYTYRYIRDRWCLIHNPTMYHDIYVDIIKKVYPKIKERIAALYLIDDIKNAKWLSEMINTILIKNQIESRD